MCPPAASSANDIGLYFSEKEIVTSLEGIIGGTPLPSNVYTDINPYQYKPSVLPGISQTLTEPQCKSILDFLFMYQPSILYCHIIHVILN